MGLGAGLVQCPTGCPVAVPSRILMSESLVNVQDSAGRSHDRSRPVDRDVTYDGHSQVGMRLQAERQDRDADEKHRHQADDLRIIIVNTIPSINTIKREIRKINLPNARQYNKMSAPFLY